MRTFQTRVSLSETQENLLKSYSTLYSRIERTLFSDLQKADVNINYLKKSYLKRFGITARQFNSCKASVDGKIRSLKEIRKNSSESLREKIKKLEKRLKSKRCIRNRHELFQKLQRLKSKLQNLQQDERQGVVRLCFGSRKLFRAQYHLEENGFLSFQDWKSKWETTRNSSFFIIGSKDETMGNQSCLATLEENGRIKLRLRLPEALNTSSKYLYLENIEFAYGQTEILEALSQNKLRNELFKQKQSQYKNCGIAMSYRFVFDSKGLRIFVSFEQKKPLEITSGANGYIGVDVNVDHLAICEIDPSGNPISTKRLRLPLYGKTKNQTKAILGDQVKELITFAVAKKKPLVVEKLDFARKKRDLKSASNKHARMLSSFAYNKTLEAIKSRASKFALSVYEVSPAYTSMIGMIKFMKRYGLSRHSAAACAVARRKANFCETLPSHTQLQCGKGCFFAFTLPEWTKQRSKIQHLRKVSQKLRVAHAEHFRMNLIQSVGAKAPT